MDNTFFRIVIAISGLLLIAGLFLWEWLHKRALKKTEETLRQQRQRQFSGEEPIELEQMHTNEVSEELELPSMKAEREATEVINKSEAPNGAEKEPILNVIQIALVNSNKEQFEGYKLLQALEDLGMVLGEMGIYHRHFDPQNNDRFSAANLVEPGTFPDGKEQPFSTPGIILFLELSEQSNPLIVFDELVQTSNKLAEQLNGVLLDEKHQPLSKEHLLEIRNLIAVQ